MARVVPPLPVLGLLVGAAFCAGMVDAIGGGGGLITVPALLAAGLDPRVALATNKGQAVFGAVSSALTFRSRGGVAEERARVGFAAGLAGSFVGAAALLAMRPEPLRPVVIALLLGALAVMLLPRDRLPRLRLERPTLALAAVAFVLGAYDGFFGPGVGSMLIVAFITLFGDTPVGASGNAKVVNLASNLAAFTLFALKGTILFPVALPMALANAAGAHVGARLALARGDRLVRRVVVVVVLSVVAKLTRDLFRG